MGGGGGRKQEGRKKGGKEKRMYFHGWKNDGERERERERVREKTIHTDCDGCVAQSFFRLYVI